MDARQRLLDALAEVERLDEEVKSGRGDIPLGSNLLNNTLRQQRDSLVHSLLPTLSALREVVEMHELGTGGLCRACSYIDDEDCVEGEEYPCSTLRTLTRQFEEE